MILVTLGTQKFQMNRLVEVMDKAAIELGEEVFIQTGNSTYEPKNCKWQAFVDSKRFQEMIKNCSMLVTHAGVGTIMTGINAKKPIVVVPRLAEFGEHVDDHQKEIADAFEEKGFVLACKSIDKLIECIQNARKYDFQPYVFKGGKIEDIILGFIELF